MDELEEIKRKKLERLMKSGETSTRTSMPESPIEINDANFNSIISKYSLVLVDFWAGWCAPCRVMAPIIDALAKKHKGRLVYGKLNVDQNHISAKKYQAMSIPMLLIFKNGRIVDKIVGAQPQAAIESRIGKYL